jgi:anti-sigma B factor antagonist
MTGPTRKTPGVPPGEHRDERGDPEVKLNGQIEDHDVLVLELREPALDYTNVREFRHAALALIRDQPRVVLDMSGVRFVDSSGLGGLISCLRHVRGSRGDLKLCSMSDRVRELFELLRMHQVFNIVEPRDEAVRSFA